MMEKSLFTLGLYLVVGTIFIGLRWKRISAIGKSLVGERFRIAIPFLIFLWPAFAWSWISDEFRVFRCLREIRRRKSVCICGKLLRIRAGHIRQLRDEQPAYASCPCGIQTALTAEKQPDSASEKA